MAWLEQGATSNSDTLITLDVRRGQPRGYEMGRVHDLSWGPQGGLAVSHTVKHPTRAPACMVQILRPGTHYQPKTLVNTPMWQAAWLHWLGRGHGLLVELHSDVDRGSGEAFESHVYLPDGASWVLDRARVVHFASWPPVTVSPDGSQVVVRKKTLFGHHETWLYDLAHKRAT